MKSTAGLLLALSAVVPLRLNAEMLESLKTRDGREYVKVEIVAQDEVGLRIRHESGTKRIAFADLPDDLQSKYKYDPAKAAAKKAEESKALLEYEKSQTAPPAPSVKKTPEPPAAAPKEEEDLASDLQEPADDTEIEKLEGYIAEMKTRSKAAAGRAMILRRDAQKERSRTRTVVDGYNRKGASVSKEVPDKSGYVKAEKMEEEAKAIDRQILGAKVLIAKAEAKYYRLRGMAPPAAPEE